jgi:hypothetical protein
MKDFYIETVAKYEGVGRYDMISVFNNHWGGGLLGYEGT